MLCPSVRPEPSRLPRARRAAAATPTWLLRTITLLALVTAMLAGCGGECRGSVGLNASRCGGVVRARYRLTTLHIPTQAQAEAGELAGVDLDGVDGACGVPDYPGSVDNTLVGLVSAFYMLAPNDPLDVQAQLDEGLFCTATEPDCAGVVLDVRVTPLTGRSARVELIVTEGGAQRVLATDEDASGDRDGRLTAHFDAVALELPMVDGEDQRVFSLPLTGVVLTGTLELEGIRDLVLAGVVHRDALVSEFILPLITPLDPSALFDDLDGLFDVMTNPESATCDGFSVGLTATATALPAHLF